MRSRAISCLSVATAAGALTMPAAASAADPASIVGGTVPTAAKPLPAADHVLLPIVQERKAPFVKRNARLAKRLARVKGEHLAKDYAKQLRAWPMADLKRHEGVLRRAIARAKRQQRAEARAARAAAGASAATTSAGTAAPAGGSTANGTMQVIAACESGGNPAAVDPTGTYRGKYQFTYSTWAAMGGSGDPAAASEAEQDARAAQLYATAGPGQWPVCGR